MITILGRVVWNGDTAVVNSREAMINDHGADIIAAAEAAARSPASADNGYEVDGKTPPSGNDAEEKSDGTSDKGDSTGGDK